MDVKHLVSLTVVAVLVSGASLALAQPDPLEDLAGDPGSATTEDNANASDDNVSEEQRNASADASAPKTAARTAGSSGASDPGTSTRATEPVGSWGWISEHGWWITGLVGLAAVTQRVRSGKQDPNPGTEQEDQQKPKAESPGSALDNPGPDGALMLGRQALEDGDPETARGWFQAAAELDPELEIAHLCLGLAHLDLGEPDDAVEALTRAVELNPGNGTARYHLARAYAMQGDVERASVAVGSLVQAGADVVEDALEDPAFANLRDDPRWLAALGELG